MTEVDADNRTQVPAPVFTIKQKCIDRELLKNEVNERIYVTKNLNTFSEFNLLKYERILHKLSGIIWHGSS